MIQYRTISGIAVSISVIVLATMSAFAQDPGKAKFLDRGNMNILVKPGDNFVEYAGGTWLKKNSIPAKETSWGSFNILRDFNVKAIRTILNETLADANAKPGSVKRRVADFYKAAMDSATAEQLKAQPIQADLARINELKSNQQVLDEIVYQRSHGVGSPLFGMFVAQDRKHPERMIVQLSQGGLSMPDRDYYLKSDARSKKIQSALNAYIVSLFSFTGASDEEAKKNAETIFAIEKRLAKAQMSRTEMRDPLKTYNKFAIADFSKTTPSIEWQSVLKKIDITGQDSLLVNVPKFFLTADSLIKNTPLSDWQVYLKWNVLRSASSYLSKSFVDAEFAYNQALTGQKVQSPRWQKASSLTDGTIGELLGQLYVEKYFKPEAKARMQVMIANLVKAYEIRIKQLDWMSDATKQKALDKLHAFTPKIAYPDHWKEYKGLEITDKTLLQNVRNASRWSYLDNIQQLGKPVDRTRWGMTPPTVNAYYNPVLNEIVFPAGILQYPFFHPDADDAFNYGGIGAVIGHEISHGFDDSGSQYDKDGSLHNWWTPDDRKRFEEKAKLLQQQFDAYTVLDTLHVNGKLTLGENIGDLGGLNAAYEAFKMTPQGKSNKKIDGFTPDQRFFLAWAQVWRIKVLPERTAQLILTDSHSPGDYRAIGAPSNMDAWYKAFNIQPGDKLYKKPEDRIKIW
ncbi:MAG: M13 family metallopeptidase [Bacteroidetes bacterium]|nr:M13 family metallopeptidase [Bacteroidota bacterium]